MIEKVSLKSPIRLQLEKKSSIDTNKKLNSVVMQTVSLVSKIGPVYFI